MKHARTRELALQAVHKHLDVHRSFDHYTGIVTLHALARLATITNDPAIIDEARERFLPYARDERHFTCNFPNYQCGGNGAAYLLWKGHLPEVEPLVRKYAEQIMNDAPRDREGILCHPHKPEQERVFIDVAFAITPFMLFAGLALKDERYVNEAFQQTSKMVRVLRNADNGLIHQSKNFNGQLPGRISEDAWSRGNGWGAYAMTELACHLPKDHPHKAEAIRMYRDHVDACARVQDPQGLWRQEMTEVKDAYVETSGSGLLLYEIGAGLEAGVLDASHRPRFEQGVRGLLAYIADDGDIFHTCRGCLCPGNGTKMDYMARAPLVNDPHAFGPVALAMGQAHALGINEITRL